MGSWAEHRTPVSLEARRLLALVGLAVGLCQLNVLCAQKRVIIYPVAPPCACMLLFLCPASFLFTIVVNPNLPLLSSTRFTSQSERGQRGKGMRHRKSAENKRGAASSPETWAPARRRAAVVTAPRTGCLTPLVWPDARPAGLSKSAADAAGIPMRSATPTGAMRHVVEPKLNQRADAVFMI